MTTLNYYEFINAAPTATISELDAAIMAKYNESRRLVTHHEPSVALQATQALQVLEQARTTLLDPNKKAEYDASMGIGGMVGGLADPQALLQRLNMGTPGAPQVMAPPMIRPSAGPISGAPVDRTDAWVCPRCQATHPIGTRFCMKCGLELAVTCPKCGATAKAGAGFCPKCGVNINQARDEKAFAEHLQVTTQNQAAQNAVLLKPIIAKANLAGFLASYWWWIFVGIYGIVWLAAYIIAGQVNSMPPALGDEIYRRKAIKARQTARINLTILVGGFVLVVFLALLSSLFR